MNARDLIKAALRSSGLASRGLPIPSDEMNDGLQALNMMLDYWRTQQLFIPSRTRESAFTMVIGQSSYTYGTGGDFNSTRPLDIHSMWLVDGGNTSYPLTRMTPEKYRDITLKTLNSRPERFYFEPNDPLSNLYFDSEPTEADTLEVIALKPVTTFATLDTEDSVPPEYVEILKYNLAVRLCPEYGKEPPRTVAGLALDGFENIKRQNLAFRIPELVVDQALYRSRPYNINTG